MKTQTSNSINIPRAEYFVIHPMFDVPEAKCDPSGLGPIKMSASVRISLVLLRGYLILMGLMLSYHILDLAGLFGRHGVK